jgi:hypothetical protein
LHQPGIVFRAVTHGHSIHGDKDMGYAEFAANRSAAWPERNSPVTGPSRG